MCRLFVSVWDSNGFYEPGIADGNFVFEGRYKECVSAHERFPPPDVKHPIHGMHCLMWWWVSHSERKPTYM